MEITKMIVKLQTVPRKRISYDIELNNIFTLHDLYTFKNQEDKIKVAFPEEIRESTGELIKYAYPTDREFRNYIEETIIKAAEQVKTWAM